jgi:multiple sugar transport system substrate-binding protein
MKRTIRWTLVVGLALAALGLTSCGPDKAAKGPVTLNALFMKQAGYSEDDVTAATKEFEAANPGVTVKLAFVPYEQLEQKITTSAEAGTYDVVLSDGPFTAKFAKAGLVQAVPEIAEADVKDIFPGALDSCVYQGKLYGMPWMNDVKYLFYNKKMLKAAGFDHPPKTMDEMVAMAKVMKQKKIVEYPIAWSWAQAEALMCDYTTLSAAFGGAMFDADGKPTLTAEGNEKALAFMAQSIKDGVSNPKSTEFIEDDVANVFTGGQAAFAVNWTYMYAWAKDATKSKVVDDVGLALVPGSDKAVSATVNGGQPLAITKGSKNPVEAWNYITYMTGKAFQKKYSKNSLPIWKSLYVDAEVVANNPEIVSIAKDQYEHIANRPKVPYYSNFSSQMQVKLQEALLGKKTSEVALAEAQTMAAGLAAQN